MPWSAPRTWVAGETVTASIGNAHWRDNLLALADRHQVIRKSADESVTSSTTLQNDDHLLFTVVAGQSYVFELWLVLFSTSAVPDVKVGFTFPAGTMAFGAFGGDGTAQGFANSAATSGTTVVALGVAVSTSPNATNGRVSGSFLCTTGGTVQMQWAQNVSDAVGMTVKAGSTLTVMRVAV